MTDAAKTSILEHLRLTKETKEGVISGSKYIAGKSAMQFFGTVEREESKRLERAIEGLNAAKTEHPEIITLIEQILPLLDDDIDKGLTHLDYALKYLRYASTIKKHEQFLVSLKFCKDMMENDTSKTGLEEMAELLRGSDILIAASMSDDAHR